MSTIDGIFAALLVLALVAVLISNHAKTAAGIQAAFTAGAAMVSKIVTVQ